MGQDELNRIAVSLAQQQKQLLEVLDKGASKKKDFFDRFSSVSPFISGILIALIGGIFTYTYNNLQNKREENIQLQNMRLNKAQVVEKFFPHLSSTDEQTKKSAIIAIKVLIDEKLALELESYFTAGETKSAGDIIMASAGIQETTSPSIKTQTPIDQTAEKSEEAWIYLGNYSREKGKWETQYCDFKDSAQPESLVGEILTVGEKTGALNVREEMPSPAARFGRAIAVLQPGSKIQIQEVRSWLSTGYIWAKISLPRSLLK